MDHIVRFTSASGVDTIEDVGSLDAAIARVEALRNDEGVANPRLYREVKVEFKTYVRASIVGEDTSAGSSSPATSSGVATPPPAGGSTAAPSTTATATPTEPPPGSMPLTPQRPTTKVNDLGELDAGDASEDDADSADDEAGEGPGRRTLFSRG